MKKILIVIALILAVLIVAVSLRNSSKKQDYTAQELEALALREYTDYLFEYGIDKRCFRGPIVEDINQLQKSFRWLSTKDVGSAVGIDVVVSVKRQDKPVLSIKGNFEMWHQFLQKCGNANKPGW